MRPDMNGITVWVWNGVFFFFFFLCFPLMHCINIDDRKVYENHPLHKIPIIYSVLTIRWHNPILNPNKPLSLLRSLLDRKTNMSPKIRLPIDLPRLRQRR